MTLYVLAVIFAVLGIVCILLPFHVAMTGLCFLALGAVCLALRLLRGKKTRKDVAHDFTDAHRRLHADGVRGNDVY